MFSYENISQKKKCSNLQMDLKLMVCRLFLNFSLFNHAKAAIQKCSVEKVFCDFNRIALQRYGMFSCKFAAYFQSTISQDYLYNRKTQQIKKTEKNGRTRALFFLIEI